MKTITRFLKPLLPVLAIMFFCTVASAQTMSELTAMQSDLQANITAATARINDPNAVAGLTQAELDAFQAWITDMQSRLSSVEEEIAKLQDEANAAQYQIDADAYTLANEGGKAAIDAAYQAELAALAAALVQRQAAYDAEQLLITQKLAVLADPLRYAAPNPMDPNTPPPFISTGDPIQDQQIVLNWLIQHGLIVIDTQ